jgi:hypothetical protein
MVDVRSRASAAKLIREFIEGRITNDEFDEQYPHRSSDPALQNIWRYLWLFWDDRQSHTLQGEHGLSPAQRALWERCVTFLQTGVEYAGPPIDIGLSAGLGRVWRKIFRERRTPGSTDNPNTPWWPFASEEQYRQHSPKAVS